MFKAPVHFTGDDTILLRTAGRVNRLADIAAIKHKDMQLVACINIQKYPPFNWNGFLRDAYLALGRLPHDDVEAHHIKGMLTDIVKMFDEVIPFREPEYSTTMGIVKKIEAWEADVIAGYKDENAPLAPSSLNVQQGLKDGYNSLEPTENPLRLKFRMDISRDIGIVPIRELQRALAALPFDIQLTTPTERATVFDKVPRLNGMMINIIPADEMTDYYRFRLQYTFDEHINDQLARDLIKERMQERKIGGVISWQIDSLVITAPCDKQDTLVEAVQWRSKVEEELLEVLSSLTLTPNGLISLKVPS